jgi:hypothetical protein
MDYGIEPISTSCEKIAKVLFSAAEGFTNFSEGQFFV